MHLQCLHEVSFYKIKCEQNVYILLVLSILTDIEGENCIGKNDFNSAHSDTS